MEKPIHAKDGWVLCICSKCGRLNYVEPHGTTAACKCSSIWVEHVNIPNDLTDTSRMYYIGPNRVNLKE